MSVLTKNFDRKKQEVDAAKTALSLTDVKAMAADAGPTRGFRNALATADGLALIAEVKKASPSQGLIRPNFNPIEVAMAYQQAGAHALSVLTDQDFFMGSAENLKLARLHTTLPCLRKDFINDPYQVYEARAWGADAVLLIVAALEPAEVSDLQALIQSLGMDALVEVHSLPEAEVAIELKCPLIGVNNRDLSNFKTSLGVSEELLPLVTTSGAIGVSESALESFKDLERVRTAGAKAVLIGTSFCSSPDIESKVREVMHW